MTKHDRVVLKKPDFVHVNMSGNRLVNIEIGWEDELLTASIFDSQHLRERLEKLVDQQEPSKNLVQRIWGKLRS
jgi:predicted phage-related endonuclease